MAGMNVGVQAGGGAAIYIRYLFCRESGLKLTFRSVP